MSHFNRSENPDLRKIRGIEGTGDGLDPLSKLTEINSKGDKELIGANRKTPDRPSPVPFYDRNDIADFEQHIAALITGWGEPDRSDLEAFLCRNPGMTIRDWKGLGPSIPLEPEGWEKPWHRLKPEEVKREAVKAYARELPCNLRQAAARHPDLIWNPLARKYRVRQPDDREGG